MHSIWLWNLRCLSVQVLLLWVNDCVASGTLRLSFYMCNLGSCWKINDRIYGKHLAGHGVPLSPEGKRVAMRQVLHCCWDKLYFML